MADDLFSSLDISVSALRAERKRMDVVMSNISNTGSTRTPEGGPYRRRQVSFQSVFERAQDGEMKGIGVEVSEVTEDMSPFTRIQDPGHPDADASGYVEFPNVQTSKEMVDLITASRSYEANTVAFKMAREMYQRSLELGRA